MGNYLVAFFKGILVIQHGFKIPPLKYSAVSHKWPDNQTWVQNLSLMTLNVGKMMDLIGVFVTAWARAHRYECESVTKRFTLLSMIHWEFTCSFCPSFFSEMSHSTVWGQEQFCSDEVVCCSFAFCFIGHQRKKGKEKGRVDFKFI